MATGGARAHPCVTWGALAHICPFHRQQIIVHSPSQKDDARPHRCLKRTSQPVPHPFQYDAMGGPSVVTRPFRQVTSTEGNKVRQDECGNR